MAGLDPRTPPGLLQLGCGRLKDPCWAGLVLEPSALEVPWAG